MKKLLIAGAVAGVFAGTAAAADVTLYGVIDTGLSVTHTSYGRALSEAGSNTAFAMASGQHNGNRLGLKGSEDLGNDLTVSFKLENGFKGDTGALGKAGKLFDREARLTLTHTSGAEVSFGRMGTLTSNAGTYGNFWNYGDALGGGWGGTVGALNTAYAQVSSRFDNAIVIKTPTMAGLTGYAMYSLGNGTENAQSSQNDRYAALGALYDNGPLGVALVAETYKPLNKNFIDNDGDEMEYSEPWNDTYSVNLGVSYDFEWIKVFAAYQYARYAMNVTIGSVFDYPGDKLGAELTMEGFIRGAQGLKGHTMTLSASAPLAGGTLYAGYTLGLQEMENKGGELADIPGYDMNTHNLYAAYDYALSARTKVYVGAALTKARFEIGPVEKASARVLEAQAGLVHTF